VIEYQRIIIFKHKNKFSAVLGRFTSQPLTLLEARVQEHWQHPIGGRTDSTESELEVGRGGADEGGGTHAVALDEAGKQQQVIGDVNRGCPRIEEIIPAAGLASLTSVTIEPTHALRWTTRVMHTSAHRTRGVVCGGANLNEFQR
jgi:hypothetical protein